LTLESLFAGSVNPAERLNDVLRDGDEVFVGLTVKPQLDSSSNIDFTAWQDAAYHQTAVWARERAAVRQSRLERDVKLHKRLTKVRDAAWDAGTALRLQAVIGAAPSMSAPPPPSVFGLPPLTSALASPAPGGRGGGGPGSVASNLSSPTSFGDAGAVGTVGPATVGVTTDVTLQSGGMDTEPLDGGSGSGFPLGTTQWLTGGDINSMFERDWAKLQCPHFLPTTKERDALKSTLQRGYGPIRDLFRFYANLLNMTAAHKMNAPGAAGAQALATALGKSGKAGSTSPRAGAVSGGPGARSGSRGAAAGGRGTRAFGDGSTGAAPGGSASKLDDDDEELFGTAPLTTGPGDFKVSKNELEILMR